MASLQEGGASQHNPVLSPGPTTAAGMAAAKGWRSSIVPSLLVGTFGYAIATFIGVAIGFKCLQPMSVAA